MTQASHLDAATGEGPGRVSARLDLAVAMRDGLELSVDVWSPIGDDPAPVIVVPTPYDKSVYGALGSLYAEAGYIAVLADVRGQNASAGEWAPFVHAGDDTEDLITWAAALPRSTGEVGMIGTSYVAHCILRAAVRRPPALRAVVVGQTPLDAYEDWFFPGGSFALAFAETWVLNNVGRTSLAHLEDGERLAARMAADYELLRERWFAHRPLRTFPPLHPDRPEVAGYFYDWLTLHAARDDYWAAADLRGAVARIDVPVLNIGGWYDVFVGSTARIDAELRSREGELAASGTRTILGPWGHNLWGRTLGDVDFGDDAPLPFQKVALAWLDRHLKGAPPVASPSPGPDADEPEGAAGWFGTGVRYFTMGDDIWRDAEAWPPPEAIPWTLWCDSDGDARSHHGNGRLVEVPPRDDAADRYRHDPDDPVPSVGGHSCCFLPVSPMGPFDQRAIESRDDVLVYTGSPLDASVTVVGDVEVDVHISTSAISTDVTAKLVMVAPDGRAINLVEGITRLGSTLAPLTPGEVVVATVRLQPTAATVPAGHRIRLEIASSNHPTYAVNTGTGLPVGEEREAVVAEQTIHHGPTYPTALRLHRLPGGAGGRRRPGRASDHQAVR